MNKIIFTGMMVAAAVTVASTGLLIKTAGTVVDAETNTVDISQYELATAEPMEYKSNKIHPFISINYKVPEGDTSFKTWMDYRTVTDTTSPQWALLQDIYTDADGFVRIPMKNDFGYGVMDDYYVVALGSYYGTTIGERYKITTKDGNIIFAMLGDLKQDIHTDETHRYSFNNDVVEFIVNTDNLVDVVKISGNCNNLEALSGDIQSIERIKTYKGD